MTNEELAVQEDKLLRALALDAQLCQRLRPVEEAELQPGLLLIYTLGDGYGAHIIRDRASGYKYKDGAGLREAVKAGLMSTLPDDTILPDNI